LDAVNDLREKNPNLQGKKIAYAGRLDPMAEGVLLIVMEDSLKEFKHFLKLDKEYEADILFGFSSDSFDVLGFPEKRNQNFQEKEVEKVLKKMQGDFVSKPPFFSSYRYKGKPLFWWARQGRLKEIELPDKKVAIYSLEILDKIRVGKKKIKTEVEEKIKKVKGDFRQEEVLEKWEKIFKNEKDDESYLVVKIKVHCSSGCYIRSIADRAGKLLSSGALLFSLKRTRVGEFKIEN